MIKGNRKGSTLLYSLINEAQGTQFQNYVTQCLFYCNEQCTQTARVFSFLDCELLKGT